MNRITLKKPTIKDFLVHWYISACGIALPFVDGGLFNVANYSILVYGWLFSVLFFGACFMKHLDTLPDITPWHQVVTSVPRIACIMLLIYFEFYWHASLLLCCWMFAAAIVNKTKTAYKEQENSTA
ncbi:MAG: hypothetical protein CMH22_16040 [Methylophaga sp.]|mgnify:FL=1|nr:hypothetical protein [Methylophaga sp.]|tara:strand:- start:108 stop:485 length:378 start_codon:yes stop_codon:yes gene_type:complete